MCDHCGCRDLTPIAVLMGEHDRLRELIGLIRRDLAAGNDAAACTSAMARFGEVLELLAPHTAKEEGALFPMLRREGSLADHVGVLEAEHADLFDAVDDLDDIVGSTDHWRAPERWRAGVLAVLHELDEHMYKEDFGLFPAALATIDGSDWDAMPV